MSELINYYTEMPKKYKVKTQQYKNFDKMHIMIPNRMALIGSSGSGKSNVLINLIIGMNCFTKIYMFVKCPDEPLYRFLIEEIEAIEEALKVKIVYVYSDIDELLPVDEYDRDETTLMIFDDVISEKQSKLKHIADLWIRGRKQNITTVFLSQSYYMISKLIRQNTEVLMFKKISTRKDLNMILADASLDATLPQLQEMYKSCNTHSITDMFMIDKTSGQDPQYLYRHNWIGLPVPQIG